MARSSGDSSHSGLAAGWPWQASSRDVCVSTTGAHGQRVVRIHTRDTADQQRKVQALLRKLGSEAHVWAGDRECQAYVALTGAGGRRPLAIGLLVLELLPRSQKCRAAPASHFLQSPTPDAVCDDRPGAAVADDAVTCSRKRQLTIQQLWRQPSPLEPLTGSAGSPILVSSAEAAAPVALSPRPLGSMSAVQASAALGLGGGRLVRVPPPGGFISTPSAGAAPALQKRRRSGRMAAMSNTPLCAALEQPTLAVQKPAADQLAAHTPAASELCGTAEGGPSDGRSGILPLSPRGAAAHAGRDHLSPRRELPVDGAKGAHTPGGAARPDRAGTGGQSSDWAPDPAAPGARAPLGLQQTAGAARSHELLETPERCSCGPRSASAKATGGACASSPAPLPKARRHRAIFGVRALWVAERARRQGTATRLLDAARRHCLMGCVPARDEIAWASWLPTTSLLAKQYCGGANKVTLFV